jgi:hypothetical protein
MWPAWGSGEVFTRFFGWEARKDETTGKTRHRWEDNMKMDLREIRIDG